MAPLTGANKHSTIGIEVGICVRGDIQNQVSQEGKFPSPVQRVSPAEQAVNSIMRRVSSGEQQSEKGLTEKEKPPHLAGATCSATHCDDFVNQRAGIWAFQLFQVNGGFGECGKVACGKGAVFEFFGVDIFLGYHIHVVDGFCRQDVVNKRQGVGVVADDHNLAIGGLVCLMKGHRVSTPVLGE